MLVQSYLFYNGRCEEAIEFYKKAIGAKVEMLMRFKDSPEPCDPKRVPPGTENNVMHACFTVGDTALMASDGCSQEKPDFKGFYLSLSAADDSEAKKLFNALADGGQVTMPLTKTFYASSFGMVTDRFGMPWMVIAEK